MIVPSISTTTRSHASNVPSEKGGSTACRSAIHDRDRNNIANQCDIQREPQLKKNGDSRHTQFPATGTTVGNMASENLIEGSRGLESPSDSESQNYIYDAVCSLESTCASSHLKSFGRPSDESQAISRDAAIANDRTPTSFLDLPRELRDEIYKYALPRNRRYQLLAHRQRARHRKLSSRFRPHKSWPAIYYALPLFHKEILEWCYRFNRFRLYASEIDRWFRFSESHHHGGQLLRHIRHLQICFERPSYYAAQTLHIGLEDDAIADVSTAFTYIKPSLKTCGCAISELIDERLSRLNALGVPLVQQRVVDSKNFGPVYGLALRFGVALTLDDGPDASARRGEKLRRLLLSRCVLCGGRNWSFAR